MDKRVFSLRPLERRDVPGMLEWMTDPTITQYFRFDASRVTEADCLAFIEAAQAQSDTRHYAIVDGNDGYLGTVSLKHIDPAAGQAEYAISCRARAHGSGAARAGTQAILRIAFQELGLRRVYLNVLADNARANAFYRKMGFTLLRRECGAVLIRGAARDLNWYEITHTEGAEQL